MIGPSYKAGFGSTGFPHEKCQVRGPGLRSTSVNYIYLNIKINFIYHAASSLLVFPVSLQMLINSLVINFCLPISLQMPIKFILLLEEGRRICFVFLKNIQQKLGCNR